MGIPMTADGKELLVPKHLIETALRGRINMGIVNYHRRREMLVTGMIVKLNIFRDLYKRFDSAKPPLKQEEKEILVKVTHEQCCDFMQQRVFRDEILSYYRERLLLLNPYGRRGSGDVSGGTSETVADNNVGVGEGWDG